MIILGNSHAISLDLEYSKNRHEYKNISHIEKIGQMKGNLVSYGYRKEFKYYF